MAYNACSCVSYAKWLSGINVGSIGLAKNHPINSHAPQVGGLIVFKGSVGHLAVVENIVGDNLTIKESNYIHCKVGTRDFNINDKDIKGYYNDLPSGI